MQSLQTKTILMDFIANVEQYTKDYYQISKIKDRYSASAFHKFIEYTLGIQFYCPQKIYIKYVYCFYLLVPVSSGNHRENSLTVVYLVDDAGRTANTNRMLASKLRSSHCTGMQKPERYTVRMAHCIRGCLFKKKK